MKRIELFEFEDHPAFPAPLRDMMTAYIQAFHRVFRTPPAIHRFPSSMAARVQDLCAVIAEQYGNDASRIWREAHDGRDLRDRLAGLPGFGAMKVSGTLAILAKRYGVEVPGLSEVLPTHPTLGDVDSPEALARYQAGKRAAKALAREAKGSAKA